MSKRLFVGNLLYRFTDNDLQEVFSQVGNVVYAKVIRYRDTGKSRGFGFVEMENEEQAKRAIEELNGAEIGGRKIIVAKARPRE